MINNHYYLYAFALPCCSAGKMGPGVDPRFRVELAQGGPIVAVVSRIDLERFDPKRFQGENPEDIQWLNQVAVRHHEIIQRAADSSPVIPLRVGAIFQSRLSLLAAMASRQVRIAESLQALDNRHEWAAKIYLYERHDEELVSASEPSVPRRILLLHAGTGADYLQQKRKLFQRSHECQAALHDEVRAVENLLTRRTDGCRRVRPLPASLTGRSEKMVFNAAYLLSSEEVEAWLADAEQVRENIRQKGLLLDVTGPWPPYHFCPDLSM